MNLSTLTQDQFADLRRAESEIRNLHDIITSDGYGIKERMREYVRNCVLCGAALNRARAIVPKGDWSEFVKGLQMSQSTEYRYRRLAALADRLDRPETLRIAYAQAGLIEEQTEERHAPLPIEPQEKATRFAERIESFVAKLPTDQQRAVVALIVKRLTQSIDATQVVDVNDCHPEAYKVSA